MFHFIKIMILAVTTLILARQTIGADITLHGTLIESLPCTIKPGDENSEVNLGMVSDKYLYKYQRTNGKIFQLHLENCDINQERSISIMFSGQENTNLPGLLALATGSQASGIGIGLETSSGEKIPLHKSGNAISLSNGVNIIVLRAYVAAEQVAINEKTITPGSFNTNATFVITYN